MDELLKKRIKLQPHKFKEWILYEDEDLLVINKPKGIASLAERTAPQSGLLALAKKHYHDELHLCHRLDKMTTGALIFAKNAEAYRNIALQFQKKQVKKCYWALVSGVHYYENLEISLPLHTSNHKVRVDFERGKPALTVVETLYNFKDYTLVECRPITGKSHQIRVHLAAVRSPIVGDYEYGGKDLFLSEIKKKYKKSPHSEPELALNHAYLLHAKSIQIQHPRTQEPVLFEAPLPENFKLCLDLLKKWNEY